MTKRLVGVEATFVGLEEQAASLAGDLDELLTTYDELVSVDAFEGTASNLFLASLHSLVLAHFAGLEHIREVRGMG
jgi:cyclopropane fatty-acyl-phospholipid synthase-like methyltransferase